MSKVSYFRRLDHVVIIVVVLCIWFKWLCAYNNYGTTHMMGQSPFLSSLYIYTDVK